jgi:hypothetical protein
MSLIIFSHSEYSFLWPIIEETLQKIKHLDLCFACNKTEISKPLGFTKYIEYNDKLSYSERWIKDILPNIDKQYILIIHDVQIITNCNENFINNIIQIMQINNVDRCSLNVFNGIDIIKDYNIELCNLNTASGKTLVPYDNCPAIWKKESFKQLFETFQNESYRTSELNENLQNFCRNNFKCFGLQKTNDAIYYCLGRPFLENFKILFITIKNELTFPVDVYMDMKNDFLYYFEKYNLSEKIKINNNYGFILNNFNYL